MSKDKKRKSGDGTVRERKDGRWEGRIVIGYDVKGLPKTKNVLGKTKAECEKKLIALKAEIGSEKEAVSSDMEFGAWMDVWYQNYMKSTLKEHTQATYEARIYKQIIPKIGKIPLSKMTSGTLDKFYAHLKKNGRLTHEEIYGDGIANSTIRSIHAHCRAALEKAKNEGLIRKNPGDHCTLPPKKNTEIEVLTPEEMQRLLIQAREDGFYEMFLLDISTGLRRGELLALQWDDIDFKKRELKVCKQVRYANKTLHITTPKTKAANRTLVLPEPLVEVLREYKQRVNSKWLFPSPVKDEDVPRDPTACRKSLEKILERAQCKHVSFHALRHTFATQSLRYGMDIKTLASVIGHESVETTLNVYSHITDEGMKSAARTIDKTLSSAMGAPESVEAYDVDRDKPEKPTVPVFEPYKGKKRKPGKGYVKQLSKNCWQGRYTPTVNGKRISRNVYAPTEDECEAKLESLIIEMKAELGIA